MAREVFLVIYCTVYILSLIQVARCRSRKRSTAAPPAGRCSPARRRCGSTSAPTWAQARAPAWAQARAQARAPAATSVDRPFWTELRWPGTRLRYNPSFLFSLYAILFSICSLFHSIAIVFSFSTFLPSLLFPLSYYSFSSL